MQKNKTHRYPLVKIVVIFILVFSVGEVKCKELDVIHDSISCCKSSYSRSQFESLTIEQLGNEFKRIKALRCDDCRIFGCDYQVIMEYLGKRLNGKSRKEIKKIMGNPDLKDGNQWMYFWRGRHDYLIFDFAGNKGAISRWYYAYE
jgi:hypothetical protein